MCCRILAQSDIKRGGRIKRLMPARNGCYVPQGSSASVTPRASSAYHEFPVWEKIMIEVILGVATKVMSNYTNHIVHTQYDPFMTGNEWTKPVKSAA